jgi:nucleoside diphosphate kinase
MGLWGCSVAPSERTVAGAITAYFENTGYKVVELKIGKIEGMPLSEKTYMGTPGYVVEVVSITLEPEADKGTDIRKGSRLTFSDARIRVIQDRTVKDVWLVFIVSGIGLL